MRIMTVRRLWLAHRSFVAVRMSLTTPARVTGVFVAPDGSDRPRPDDQDPDAPCRRHDPARAAADHEARALPASDARRGRGPDRQPHGEDQLPRDAARARRSGRTARCASRSCAALRRLGSLGGRLGKHFVVRRIADAALYDVVDTKSPHRGRRRRRRPRHGADLHARRAPRAAARGADRRADGDAGARRRTTAASA